MTTLGDAFQARSSDSKNNFLILRLVAASLVIYGHSFGMAAKCENCHELVNRYLHYRYSGDLGVHIFFLISGFLVFASFDRKRDLGAFVRARALRILPALIVCVLLTALVVGPLVTTLPTAEYFSSARVWDYIWNNGSLYRFIAGLPGVFSTPPMQDIANGSLWTLPAEARMYLYVAVLGALGWTQSRWVANATIAALAVLWFVQPEFLPLGDSDPVFHRLGAFFAAGSLLYINRDHVPLNGKIFALLFLTAFLAFGSRSFEFSASLVICYGTFWIAFAKKVKLPRFIQDYSYGIYLYGWVVQQLVTRVRPDFGPYKACAAALVISWLCGAVSWHLVEKPFLRLKRPTRLADAASANKASAS